MRFTESSLSVLLGVITTSEYEWEATADLYRHALHKARTAAAQTAMAQSVMHYAGLLGARGDYRGALRLLPASRHTELGLQRQIDEFVFDEQRASTVPLVHGWHSALELPRSFIQMACEIDKPSASRSPLERP